MVMIGEEEDELPPVAPRGEGRGAIDLEVRRAAEEEEEEDDEGEEDEEPPPSV